MAVPKYLRFNLSSNETSPGIRFQVPCVKRQWRTKGGGLGAFKPPPSEIPKALQNRAKLNPIVKTVKNC